MTEDEIKHYREGPADAHAGIQPSLAVLVSRLKPNTLRLVVADVAAVTVMPPARLSPPTATMNSETLADASGTEDATRFSGSRQLIAITDDAPPVAADAVAYRRRSAGCVAADVVQVLDDKDGCAIPATGIALRNESLNERHWNQIQEVIHTEIDRSKGVFLLGYLLGLRQVLVQTILGSRFVEPLQKRVDAWEKSLRLFSETLDEWLAWQRSWMYLESIFKAAERAAAERAALAGYPAVVPPYAYEAHQTPFEAHQAPFGQSPLIPPVISFR